MMKLINVVNGNYLVYISVPEHNKPNGNYTYELYNAEKHKCYLYRDIDYLDYNIQGIIVYLV